MQLNRLVARVLGVLRLCCALASALVLAAWAMGGLLTDRWLWSQLVWWMPTELMVALAWLAVLVAFVLGRMALIIEPANRTSAGGRRCPATLGLVRGVMLLCAAATVWMAVIEWRSYRLVLPARTAAPGSTEVTIAFWNMGQKDQSIRPDVVSRWSEDIVVIANAPAGVDWRALVERAGGRWNVTRRWPFTVLSRWPVDSWAVVSLQLPGIMPPSDAEVGPLDPANLRDPGVAAFFVIDAPPSGGTADGTDAQQPLVLWVLDLPSDPRLHRRSIMERVVARLGAFEGPVSHGDRAPSALALRGFPGPDVVVGDFNIPRGSGSLELLLDHASALTGQRFVDAYASAGAGPGGTFLRTIPLLHIDLAYVRASHRVLGYSVHDPGSSRHRAQRVRFERGR